MPLKRPIALITGGSKRLGAAMARDLIKHGFDIAIHYNEASQAAEDLVSELKTMGGSAMGFQADLSINYGKGLIENITKKMGHVSLLINNASLFLDDHIGALNDKIWNDHFALHLHAPVILSDALTKLLPQDETALIVNMIDQRVWKLNPNFLSYTLSKSALWTLTQTLAQALAPKIRVNAIAPGPSLKSPRQNAEDFLKQTQSVLLHHGPEIEEFGATIRYFWKQKSITGQMIALDGGQHLMWETADLIGQNE
ncbi:SDR family oxidoreductase [Bartonella tamiae]|uniref:Short chain dehydrogenase n=1 Tax=Bartonella tamiae Th239 TaxID=1094558 RepID=J1K0W4_9HYPH|nr:SDR family oxidoreductase [Bartonella tamiae]EJF90690.1 hypothetical protein ME5_01091 [Bartonella tamiae Th239]EJF93933.1 hypothetical protein MEG_00791 [Bartonella tamiae Th307]